MFNDSQNVQQAIVDVDNKTDANSAIIATNTTNIEKNTNDIASNTTNITTNTNSISTINDRITYYSNPNLLDNWYFINPINQKGQTSVVLSNSNEGYIFFDRWTFSVGGSTNLTANLTLTSQGLHFQEIDASTIMYISQMIENGSSYLGKVFTITVLTTNGLSTPIVAQVPETMPTSNYRFRIANTNIGLNLEVWQIYSNSSIGFQFNTIAGELFDKTIVAIKVEIGDKQTLAHQDSDGNWILNDPPPNYEQELAKCWRYYQPVYIMSKNDASYIRNNSMAVDIQLPVPMCKTPVATNLDKIRFDTSTGIGAWKVPETTKLTASQFYANFIITIPSTENITTIEQLLKCRMHSMLNSVGQFGPIWLDANL